MERVAVRRSAVRSLRLLLALALLVMALPGALPAATYVITTLAEDTTNNGNCTLREALLAASTDSTNDQCIGDVGADTIVLDAVGTYSLVAGDISSATRTLTIRGDGDHRASDYVVDLGDAQRLLHVLGNSTLILEHFTLRRGFSSSTGGAVFAEDSDLTLRGMEIRTSAAVDGAGVGFFSHGGKTLDVEGSLFENNGTTSQQSAGAGLYANLQAGGTVRIVGSTFAENSIETASGSFSRTGAGLSISSFAPANVEIRHVGFFTNWIDAPSFANGAGAYLNLGNQTGGAVELEDLRFQGNSFTQASGTNGSVALTVAADGGTVAVRRVTMLSNPGGTTRSQGSIQIST
ncbi:MAG: CSLREA domain-containing protein, partial [Thermoanaerobaculia bacterium]